MEKQKSMVVKYNEKENKYYVSQTVDFIPRVMFMVDGCYRYRNGLAISYTEPELTFFMHARPDIEITIEYDKET